MNGLASINWTEYLGGGAAAPWLWWAAALVVLIVLLGLALKFLGLFPE